jgi:methylenetetrahydrofolate reductase (NADPH)
MAFAIEQSKELLAAGMPVLNYYLMGKSDNVQPIAATLF